MDARIDRDLRIKNSISTAKSAKRPQTWYEWFWRIPAPNDLRRPDDAAHDPALRAHFTQMLDHVEPPETFKPSEVAQLLTDKELFALGYEKWEEAIAAVYVLAWEMREFGHCEILRKGKVIPDDTTILKLDGPVRIRRCIG